MNERPGIPFVPASLDDADLTSAQFRVFCRIARRSQSGGGECWESVANIALGTRLDPKTVRAAIQELEDRGMVISVSRPGSTSLLQPRPESEWSQPHTPANRHPTQSTPYPIGTSGADWIDTPSANSSTPTVSHHDTPSADSRDPSQSAPDEGSKEGITTRHNTKGSNRRTEGVRDATPEDEDQFDLEVREELRKRFAQSHPDWTAASIDRWAEMLDLGWREHSWRARRCDVHSMEGWRSDLATYLDRFVASFGTLPIEPPLPFCKPDALAAVHARFPVAAEALVIWRKWSSDLWTLRHFLSPHGDAVADLEAFMEREAATTPPPEDATPKVRREAPIELEIPANLQTPAFEQAWSEWMKVRRAMKKPGSWQAMFSRQLQDLSDMGPEDAVRSIHASIAAGWLGLFSPKASGARSAITKRGTSTPDDNLF